MFKWPGQGPLTVVLKRIVMVKYVMEGGGRVKMGSLRTDGQVNRGDF